MMDNLLLNYFQQRMHKDLNAGYQQESPGPVITISRQYGCPGKIVAEKLAEKLNQNYQVPWKWIDKEILEQLAEELNLNPSAIKDIRNFEDRKITDYIALLLSKEYFPGEKKIKNTLSEIILSLANGGNVIIVGRAGYYITNQVASSYHVRLYAPLDWRVDHMSEKRSITYQSAMKLVEDMNKKRLQFLDYFKNDGIDYKTYNREFDCSIVEIDKMVEMILKDVVAKFDLVSK